MQLKHTQKMLEASEELVRAQGLEMASHAAELRHADAKYIELETTADELRARFEGCCIDMTAVRPHPCNTCPQACERRAGRMQSTELTLIQMISRWIMPEA